MNFVIMRITESSEALGSVLRKQSINPLFDRLVANGHQHEERKGRLSGTFLVIRENCFAYITENVIVLKTV